MLRAEITQNDKIISALEGLQLGAGNWKPPKSI